MISRKDFDVRVSITDANNLKYLLLPANVETPSGQFYSVDVLKNCMKHVDTHVPFTSVKLESSAGKVIGTVDDLYADELGLFGTINMNPEIKRGYSQDELRDLPVSTTGAGSIIQGVQSQKIIIKEFYLTKVFLASDGVRHLLSSKWVGFV